jgi:hypothetical protein
MTGTTDTSGGGGCGAGMLFSHPTLERIPNPSNDMTTDLSIASCSLNDHLIKCNKRLDEPPGNHVHD